MSCVELMKEVLWHANLYGVCGSKYLCNKKGASHQNLSPQRCSLTDKQHHIEAPISLVHRLFEDEYLSTCRRILERPYESFSKRYSNEPAMDSAAAAACQVVLKQDPS